MLSRASAAPRLCLRCKCRRIRGLPAVAPPPALLTTTRYSRYLGWRIAQIKPRDGRYYFSSEATAVKDEEEVDELGGGGGGGGLHEGINGINGDAIREGINEQDLNGDRDVNGDVTGGLSGEVIREETTLQEGDDGKESRQEARPEGNQKPDRDRQLPSNTTFHANPTPAAPLTNNYNTNYSTNNVARSTTWEVTEDPRLLELKQDYMWRSQIYPRSSSERVLAEYRTLEVNALGSPAKAIVLRSNLPQRVPLPTVTVVPEKNAAAAALGVDIELCTPEQAFPFIESLRPQDDLPFVSSDTLRALADELNEFKVAQLQYFARNYEPTPDPEPVRPRYSWILSESPWTPIADEDPVISELKLTRKPTLIRKILQDCWKLRTRQLVQGRGRLQVEVSEPALKLLLRGPTPVPTRLSAEYLDQGDTFKVSRLGRTLVLVASRPKVESILQQVDNILRRVEIKTFPISAAGGQKFEPDLLEELGNITYTVIGYSSSAPEVWVAWISEDAPENPAVPVFPENRNQTIDGTLAESLGDDDDLISGLPEDDSQSQIKDPRKIKDKEMTREKEEEEEEEEHNEMGNDEQKKDNEVEEHDFSPIISPNHHESRDNIVRRLMLSAVHRHDRRTTLVAIPGPEGEPRKGFLINGAPFERRQVKAWRDRKVEWWRWCMPTRAPEAVVDRGDEQSRVEKRNTPSANANTNIDSKTSTDTVTDTSANTVDPYGHLSRQPSLGKILPNLLGQDAYTPPPVAGWPSGGPWLEPQTHTAATFGHVVHSTLSPALPQPYPSLLRDDCARILSPVVPPPSVWYDLDGRLNKAGPVSSSLRLLFQPHDGDYPAADKDLGLSSSSSSSPTSSSSSASLSPPSLELVIRLSQETVGPLGWEKCDKQLFAVLSTHHADIMLPASPVDVRVTQTLKSAYDAAVLDSLSPLGHFFDVARLDPRAGHFSTPSGFVLDSVPAAPPPAGGDIVPERSSVVYAFAGLELCHVLVKGRHPSFALRYSTIDAGYHGGRRAELSLVSSGPAPGETSEEHSRRYVEAIVNTAANKDPQCGWARKI